MRLKTASPAVTDGVMVPGNWRQQRHKLVNASTSSLILRIGDEITRRTMEQSPLGHCSFGEEWACDPHLVEIRITGEHKQRRDLSLPAKLADFPGPTHGVQHLVDFATILREILERAIGHRIH
jgi:hypothetical protein